MATKKSDMKSLLSKYKNTKTAKKKRSSSSDSKYISPYKKAINKYMKDPVLYDNVSLNERKSISLLLIIIDELPTEYIWRDWLNDMNAQYKSRVEIFIHAKHPNRIKSSWVRDRLIKSNLKPTWGSVELSISIMLLLRNAVHSPRNTDYYMFLSESCIPIYPIHTFFEILDTHNNSWYESHKTPNNGYSNQQQFQPLEEHIPKKCIIKTDQWVLLNKKNAYQIANFENDTGVFHRDLDFWNIFNDVKASDEMWISTLLCIVNDDTEDINSNRATYVVWENGDKSPMTFKKITRELIHNARESGALFCRKIQSNSRTTLTNQWHDSVV